MHIEIKFKINEAKFFLQKMKDNLDHDPEKRFYLSAFLSAARSIDYYLISQFGRKNGFEDWRNKKIKELSIDTKVKDLINYRNQSIHDKSIQTETGAHTRIASTLNLVKESEQIPYLPMLPEKNLAKLQLSDSPYPKVDWWNFGDGYSYEVVPFCETELENIIKAAVDGCKIFEKK